MRAAAMRAAARRARTACRGATVAPPERGVSAAQVGIMAKHCMLRLWCSCCDWPVRGSWRTLRHGAMWLALAAAVATSQQCSSCSAPGPLSCAGLAVAPTSDSEHDVLQSLHSQAIQQPPLAGGCAGGHRAAAVPAAAGCRCLGQAAASALCRRAAHAGAGRPLKPHRLAAPPRLCPADGRSPSFMLKGLSWRSFTQRRPPQLAAPPAMHPGQTQQPPASAQITPRLQPSQLPTPRMLASGGEPSLLPPLANGHSQQLPPMPGLPGQAAIASALHAAATGGRQPEPAAGDGTREAAARTHSAQQQLPEQQEQRSRHAEPAPEQQQQQQQQQQQAQQQQRHAEQPPEQAQQQAQQPAAEQEPELAGQPPALQGPGTAAGGEGGAQEQQRPELSLTSWRSDAVQLPEQLLLPDGLPASPTSSMDTTGSTVMRPRGR